MHCNLTQIEKISVFFLGKHYHHHGTALGCLFSKCRRLSLHPFRAWGKSLGIFCTSSLCLANAILCFSIPFLGQCLSTSSLQEHSTTFLLSAPSAQSNSHLCLFPPHFISFTAIPTVSFFPSLYFSPFVDQLIFFQ